MIVLTVTTNDKWYHKMDCVNMPRWTQNLIHEGAFDVAPLVTLYFAMERILDYCLINCPLASFSKLESDRDIAFRRNETKWSRIMDSATSRTGSSDELKICSTKFQISIIERWHDHLAQDKKSKDNTLLSNWRCITLNNQFLLRSINEFFFQRLALTNSDMITCTTGTLQICELAMRSQIKLKQMKLYFNHLFEIIN